MILHILFLFGIFGIAKGIYHLGVATGLKRVLLERRKNVK